MSKETFEKASNNLWRKLQNDGVKGIMMYRPFSDDYWKQYPKIVICNFENYGYQDKDITDLTFEEFRIWVGYRKSTSRTVRYSSVFINALKQFLDTTPNIEFTIKDMKKSYKNADFLHQAMKNVMYMNMRPTSATSNVQETDKTCNIIHKYKTEMQEYIKSLDAHIFIISTRTGLELFNYIFDLKQNKLKYKYGGFVNGMMVYSVPFLGRFFGYKYYYEKALQIENDWSHSDKRN